MIEILRSRRSLAVVAGLKKQMSTRNRQTHIIQQWGSLYYQYSCHVDTIMITKSLHKSVQKDLKQCPSIFLSIQPTLIWTFLVCMRSCLVMFIWSFQEFLPYSVWRWWKLGAGWYTRNGLGSVVYRRLWRRSSKARLDSLYSYLQQSSAYKTTIRTNKSGLNSELVPIVSWS